MATRRSVKWSGLAASQIQIREKVTALVYAVRQASLRTKVVFGSAFALAFLIAPVAALMVAGNSSSTANNGELPAPDPGTASTADSQAAAQDPANSSSTNNGAGDSSSSSSMSVNVSNDSASVSVGGQTVQSPADGSVTKTINSGNGNTTTVNIQSNTSTTGSSHTSTNKSVHVSSHSSNVSESSQ